MEYLGRVKVVLIGKSQPRLLRGQGFVEGVLAITQMSTAPSRELYCESTMERITTHGKFSFLTMAWESVDLPEPELPATPMMLTSAHGGE